MQSFLGFRHAFLSHERWTYWLRLRDLLSMLAHFMHWEYSAISWALSYSIRYRFAMKRKLFDKTGIVAVTQYFSLRFWTSVTFHTIPFVSSLVSHRIFREKQYAERRLKDFDDALTREAVRDGNVHNFFCLFYTSVTDLEGAWLPKNWSYIKIYVAC